MADGSVTIGVVLDTAAFSASAAAVQGQISGVLSKNNQKIKTGNVRAAMEKALDQEKE